MSIENKFLSLWLEFDEVYREDKSIGCFENTSELADVLSWIKRFGEEYAQAYYCKCKKFGTLRIKTTVNKKAAPCEVRLYKPAQKNSEYSYIKRVTDEQGKVQVQVPAGMWQMKISHGFSVASVSNEILISPEEDMEREIDLQSFADMKEMGWYNGDLHHHSIYSSPVFGGTDDVVDRPAQVRLFMQAAGCDFGALSDHHNILNHEEWQQEEREDFVPVISKEISTSNGHIMAIGAKTDVVYDIPYGKNRTDEALRSEFMKVANEIKESGGVPQVNHPFSDGPSISWRADFIDLLSAFQSIEIWNGANPMFARNGNGNAFKLWLRLLAQGVKISATAGSDTHCLKLNQYEEIKENICMIMKLITDMEREIPDNLKNRMQILKEMWEQSFEVLNNWIQTTLGTAGVRNYIYIEGKMEQEKVLDSICRGRSFITNGPLLFPEIDGAGPGETRSSKSNLTNVQIRLWSEKMPKEVCLYLSDGQIIKKEIISEQVKNYSYSCIFEAVNVEHSKWVVCTAEGDCTNLAIANPIYI